MNKKIVIIDDEIHIRSLMEQTLEDLEDDYNVIILSAGDGLSGIDMIRREKPDLVFLDVMMPGKNGYDICMEIKGEPEFKDTVIILLTASGQKMDKKKGYDAGAFRYCTKPFDPDEILELAKDVLGL